MLKLVFAALASLVFVLTTGCSPQAESKAAVQPAAPLPAKLQASDLAEAQVFQAAALKRLTASNNLTKLIMTSLSGQSRATGYMMLKRGYEQHIYTAVEPLVAPAALRDDTPTKEFLNTFDTALAVRAAAFSKGMAAADGGKISEVVEMHEKIDRAQRQMDKATTQLAALAAHYQTLK